MLHKGKGKMETLRECRSSWYKTNFIICPDCKERAGYHTFFDSGIKHSFRCKCNLTLTQIKKIYEEK